MKEKKFKKKCCEKCTKKGKRCSRCPLHGVLPGKDKAYRKKDFKSALKIL